MAKAGRYKTGLDEDALPEYGDWLRSRRRQAGLTQDDVAAIAGVSRAAVSCFERGTANTSLFNAEAMLNAVGLTLTVTSMERGRR